MGNCLFLHAGGWGVDHQEQTKPQIPGYACGGMVTGQIEPTIKYEVILGLQPREKVIMLKVKTI